MGGIWVAAFEPKALARTDSFFYPHRVGILGVVKSSTFVILLKKKDERQDGSAKIDTAVLFLSAESIFEIDLDKGWRV
ncbi:MAG: hypothetical protein ACK40Q_06800 [Pseudothermotoga sp.]